MLHRFLRTLHFFKLYICALSDKFKFDTVFTLIVEKIVGLVATWMVR